MLESLFPPEAALQIQRYEKVNDCVMLFASSTKSESTCPDCHHSSRRVHSMYERHPADLPCFGFPVQLVLSVRRYFCDHAMCGRVTFAEAFPELVAYKARRTMRLQQQHLVTAFECGGELGRRVVTALGMAISGDTLLRAIRGADEPLAEAPRVLGIDDWAMCKGRTYGTILVDLEAHKPIDLLDSRDSAAVEAWLADHPAIEIVSRDRSREYAKAITTAAPEAEQVADRWHLLKNLREATEKLLLQKPACLQAAATIEEIPFLYEIQVESDETDAALGFKSNPNLLEMALGPPAPTKAQRERAARWRIRHTRYEKVNELHQSGRSMRSIAAELNMAKRTVRKYILADKCPQYTIGYKHPSKLDPHIAWLEERWQQGCTNATQLWRELVAEHGFSGSRGLVARWAVAQRKLLPVEMRYARRQPADVRPLLTRQVRPTPWSSSRVSWLLLKKQEQLESGDLFALSCVLDADKQVRQAYAYIQEFITMMKQRQHQRLDDWLSAIVDTKLPGLTGLANGILSDLQAVRNAFKLEWSNGQTEGQVNRLKYIKRQMYGRAKFDLLRKRVLYRSQSP